MVIILKYNLFIHIFIGNQCSFSLFHKFITMHCIENMNVLVRLNKDTDVTKREIIYFWIYLLGLNPKFILQSAISASIASYTMCSCNELYE